MTPMLQRSAVSHDRNQKASHSQGTKRKNPQQSYLLGLVDLKLPYQWKRNDEKHQIRHDVWSRHANAVPQMVDTVMRGGSTLPERKDGMADENGRNDLALHLLATRLYTGFLGMPTAEINQAPVMVAMAKQVHRNQATCLKMRM